jgi:hypothetical protein
MTRQAAAIAFDAADELVLSEPAAASGDVALSAPNTIGMIALAIAAEDQSQAGAVLDVGVTSCPANEVAEALKSLAAEGFAVGTVQSPAADLVIDAASLALLELRDLQPRAFVNETVFSTNYTNQPVEPLIFNPGNTIRPPTVTRSA